MPRACESNAGTNRVAHFVISVTTTESRTTSGRLELAGVEWCFSLHPNCYFGLSCGKHLKARQDTGTRRCQYRFDAP